mmetsp:Transcript_42935/g.132660  ORF Transcript_42935/g.132660 Transcript_42935/m.132660 type:complete len:233 (+) Transcript_42935:864-1562(+)
MQRLHGKHRRVAASGAPRADVTADFAVGWREPEVAGAVLRQRQHREPAPVVDGRDADEQQPVPEPELLHGHHQPRHAARARRVLPGHLRCRRGVERRPAQGARGPDTAAAEAPHGRGRAQVPRRQRHVLRPLRRHRAALRGHEPEGSSRGAAARADAVPGGAARRDRLHLPAVGFVSQHGSRQQLPGRALGRSGRDEGANAMLHGGQPAQPVPDYLHELLHGAQREHQGGAA